MGTLAGTVHTGGRALAVAVVMVAAAIPGIVGADATFDRGQALYENHCRTCHESWAHTRDGRAARTLEDIRARVKAWSIHSDLDWNDEDVDDVTQFLAERYYKLEERD